MLVGAVFFLFFNTGPSNTALANVVSPSVRASAFAVNIFVIHALGDAPSPPILGYISGRYGWNTAFGVVAGCMVLAGVLWLVGMPHLKPDTDAVTAAEAQGAAVPLPGG
jgi:predicted MFS family arabinose efflux permease